MKLSTSGLGQQAHEGENKCLNSELWHACAGPHVSLPSLGSRVVYFPQGHSEQVAATTNKEVDAHIPNYPSLPPQLICQLHNVTMHADVETDEVYAQMTLQPLTPQEQKDTYIPVELGIPTKQPTNYFCKTLTASDTSTHGGFSVPRLFAEKVFPPLDFSQQPPRQELIARDLHDVEWKFTHVYRGQPKRHLLARGWSVFVSAKRLVAGDSVLFICNEKNQLLLGIRRATRPQTVMPSSVLSSDSMHSGLFAAAAHAAAPNSCFTIFYNPRASPSEFVIPLAKYIKAVYHTRMSVGMRFQMLFETEESSVRRYMGTITGISDLDPVRWPNSHWRSVKVGWEVGWNESTAGERQPRVSLWEIEPLTTLTTFPMYPSPLCGRLKHPWYGGTSSFLGETGEQGLHSLNFQNVGMLPWTQQRVDANFVRNDLNQQYQGFQTLDKQNLSMPDSNSKGEEDLQPMQLQIHQYSDAIFSIPDLGSNSGTPLEELEETPSDPGELEDLNCDPMEVPPTISHHFSILHVLDLSYTEINSLPQSISRLVALQKLFLRSCDLLHELPPEIGELSNLQVLDLEGTEILCLPKEIAKLVNLTCLKVSFYGYANKTVIPRRVLSNLSRLNELIIDVTPYGKWWDVEVEAIIDDLCSLDELRTLKLYLPAAELLEGLTRIFSRLANFRFTVGRHEEHFISRLPCDVEEEFNNQEKLEKGLKYINGSRIPSEITKVFKHANAFFLQRHWTAKSLSEFGHENMNEVKFCLVMECNEFRTIIDSEQFYQGKDGRSESEDFMDIDENIVLGSLQKLIIRYMKNMVSIWNGPVGKGSLSNLKSLALHTCPILATVFTIDMLSNLINLEELIVEDCPKIDSLVSLQSSNSKSGPFLPNLKKISLLELPELVSISSGLWIAPKLEKMVIFYCAKLKKLSTMDVSSTNLKVIKGEKEWWDALKWYESDLSTEHEDFLTRLFIPLRRDGDLMAQLTKD